MRQFVILRRSNDEVCSQLYLRGLYTDPSHGLASKAGRLACRGQGRFSRWRRFGLSASGCDCHADDDQAQSHPLGFVRALVQQQDRHDDEPRTAQSVTMEEDQWTPLTVRAELDHFSDREAYLVCERDGEVVDWGKVKRYSPRAGYSIACEMSTYIDRDARGGGVGEQVLEALVAFSRRLGYHHAVAKIIADNEASLRFHLKHGFELVGIQREIGIVDGKLADVAILQRVD